MNYELALKLKDAGFVFPICDHESFCGSLKELELFGYTHYPTLSELIEACGEGFKELLRREDGWVALGDTGEFTGLSALPNTRTVGAIPDIAVANLWLALNLTT